MKPRVLHAITVFNGRTFVPAAISSAIRMDQSRAEIDVLVLDDASPEPGFSEAIRAHCLADGAIYYRSPRNLGIPRNVNLGLLMAMRRGYDYVTINNSDVLFPANLIGAMIEACEAERVGSVTAWSNNVSIYSLPNGDPDRWLSDQDVVDFIAAIMADTFAGQAIDVPAGISFCIMIPTAVLRTVGIMDPIFGRGYCEETDWSRRSLAAGYRVCLAPGTFVYHSGRGSNLAAGVISAHGTTVPENEAIIDARYPGFRREVAAFQARHEMERLQQVAVEAVVRAAVRRHGYLIEPGWGQRAEGLGPDLVRVRVLDGAAQALTVTFRGFELAWPLPEGDISRHVAARLGSLPVANLFDPMAVRPSEARLPLPGDPYPLDIRPG